MLRACDILNPELPTGFLRRIWTKQNRIIRRIVSILPYSWYLSSQSGLAPSAYKPIDRTSAVVGIQRITLDFTFYTYISNKAF